MGEEEADREPGAEHVKAGVTHTVHLAISLCKPTTRASLSLRHLPVTTTVAMKVLISSERSSSAAA